MGLGIAPTAHIRWSFVAFACGCFCCAVGRFLDDRAPPPTLLSSSSPPPLPPTSLPLLPLSSPFPSLAEQYKLACVGDQDSRIQWSMLLYVFVRFLPSDPLSLSLGPCFQLLFPLSLLSLSFYSSLLHSISSPLLISRHCTFSGLQ